MALILRRGIQLHPCFIKNYSLGFLVTSITRKTAKVSENRIDFLSDKDFGRSTVFDLSQRWLQFVSLQHFSTSVEPGSWEVSTRFVLLRKLEMALKDHNIDEAWVIFNDFKNLYGFPLASIVNGLITELSYSLEPHWLQKACDFVLLIFKEKSVILKPELLSTLSLSLARAQMPIPASMILRIMLERANVPPVDILRVVIMHMVKTEIGTYLASNILVQICDCFVHLCANRCDKANIMKLDTMIFNLVLDACVRFKTPLKGQQIIELMAQTGVIADAHCINSIAQIHEMNGQRDEIKKFKNHIEKVPDTIICHYQKFYDSLLSLHFKFQDIDAAAELILDLHRLQILIPNKKFKKDIQKPFLVPIGSHNLRIGMKIQILPELLQKDSVLEGEDKQEFVIVRSGKLHFSDKALVKIIIGYKRHGRITDLSKLLLSIEKDCSLLEGSCLCSAVIVACIHLGWLEISHDILDDMETAGSPMDLATYMALLKAYSDREMFKESKALLRQMRKAGLIINSSDDMIASTYLSEAAASESSPTSKSELADLLVREMREEETDILPTLFELNSSVYFFCKAKMMGDALKTYRRMQDMNIHPTVQTFAYLAYGFSSLEKYRDITILWGDIKRNMENRNLVVSRDLYEVLLLNFIRGGYFERVMEVIRYMEDSGMYADQWMYRSEFLKLHKNLYKSLKASDTRNEAQRKRLDYVRAFRKWAGID